MRQPGAVTPLSDSPVQTPVRRSRRRLAVAGVLAFAAVLVGMWAYALFFASRRSPDKVPDRAWTASAEAVCVEARLRIDALPAADTFRKVEPRSDAIKQRAAVLVQANDILAGQLAALRALVPADGTTSRLTAEWLADWDTYLGDRRTHAVELGTGKDSAFKESTYKESPISNRMDAFARVNLMDRCQVPFDLA